MHLWNAQALVHTYWSWHITKAFTDIWKTCIWTQSHIKVIRKVKSVDEWTQFFSSSSNHHSSGRNCLSRRALGEDFLIEKRKEKREPTWEYNKAEPSWESQLFFPQTRQGAAQLYYSLTLEVRWVSACKQRLSSRRGGTVHSLRKPWTMTIKKGVKRPHQWNEKSCWGWRKEAQITRGRGLLMFREKVKQHGPIRDASGTGGTK